MQPIPPVARSTHIHCSTYWGARKEGAVQTEDRRQASHHNHLAAQLHQYCTHDRIAFLISNVDQALNFFDYGSLWLQGISLSLIVHYYTRKWVKLTGFEQRIILLRVLLASYVVITTALFIVGIV